MLPRPTSPDGATTANASLGANPEAPPAGNGSTLVSVARGVWRPIRRFWPLLRWLVGIAVLIVAIEALSGHQGELSGVGSTLAHLRWWWLFPALGAEAASLLSFVVVQQRLLNAGGLTPPIRPLTEVTLASQAITNSVPGGPAIAAVYGFRWYRRLGADDTLAGWALVGSSVSAALSLALLAAIGLVLATEEGASLDLVPVVIGALVVTVAVGTLFVYERPLAIVARWAFRTSHRFIGRPDGDHEARIERLLERVAVVRLDRRKITGVVAWAFSNWFLDCTCFGFAFLATGSGVPWKGLLLAYGAGQLAANLPFTPGGLGAVEGSITIALAYFGGDTTADISAVLVYRLLSFWLVLVVGWASWGLLAWGVRRGRWARAARGARVEPNILEVEDVRARSGAESITGAAAVDPAEFLGP
jgi:uncharacterized protein (TIRG00374 family)